MTGCDLDTSVPDWIIEHPQTLRVFERLGIDISCGGKSLGYLCGERGLDPADVLQQLYGCLELPAATPVLASIQVGLPQTYSDGSESGHERWTSGIEKHAVTGHVHVGFTNLEGDGQADRVHHGGIDKAVLGYAAKHYVHWRAVLHDAMLPFGAFGENLTIDGLSETEVCIGDTWRVGDAVVLQVSQPRQPCWKLNRRWKSSTLLKNVLRTGRTGWYFRVLAEGSVAAGMRLTLAERPYAEWSIARATEVMHSASRDPTEVAELAALPLLSQSWRRELTERLQTGSIERLSFE